MKANPTDIFDYVVENLPSGQYLIIDCDNESQLDRIRMALYRQRAKLEKTSPLVAATITISKRVNNKAYSIVIGRDVEDVELYHVDSEGNKTPISLKSKAKDLELERLKALMREDGKSEEEIEEYFQN